MAGVTEMPGEWECPVCNEDFEDAKILPCAHVVCRSCVLQWLQKEGRQAKCPLCRGFIIPQPAMVTGPAPTTDQDLTRLVDDLPTDLVSQALVDSHHTLSTAKVCVCGKPADGFCLNCRLKFCAVCAKVHQKVPSTRDHALEDLSSLDISKVMASYQLFCPDHHEEQAKMYCPSHQVLICMMCSVTKHQTCSSLQTVGSMAEVKRKELSQSSSRLVHMKHTLQAQINELDMDIATTCANFKTMQEEVKKTFDDLQWKLEAQRHRLNAEIQRKKNRYLETHNQTKNYLEKQRASIMTISRLTDHLSSAPDGPMLAMLVQLKLYLDSNESQCCGNLMTHIDDTAPEELHFDAKLCANLKKQIAKLGHFESKRLERKTHTDGRVRWFFVEITDCQPELTEYPLEQAKIIEASYQDKKKTADIFDSDGNKYIIDFNSMKEFPKNDPSNGVNVIRRCMLDDDSKSSEAVPLSSRAVLITNLNPRTTNFILLYYLTNNGGSEVKRLERNKNSEVAIVHFASQQDVQTLLKRRHILNDKELLITVM